MKDESERGLSDSSFILHPSSFKGAPMTSDEILFDAEERMEKAANVFRDELRGLRTGRATPALVDSLRVEYYGSPTPPQPLGQLSNPDPPQDHPRPAADRHPPVQPGRPQEHREGHPLQRPGHVPDQRRQDDPPPGPAHERR